MCDPVSVHSRVTVFPAFMLAKILKGRNENIKKSKNAEEFSTMHMFHIRKYYPPTHKAHHQFGDVAVCQADDGDQ